MLALPKLEHEIRLLLVAHPELVQDEVLRADMLEGMTDFNEALSRLVRTIIETEALHDGLAAYVTTLQSRGKRLERRVDALRSLIHKLLNIANLTKVTLPEATLSVGRKPRSVNIFDEELIPDDYLRVKYEPNRTAIKAAIEEGKDVAGAEMDNGGENLTIRMN